MTVVVTLYSDKEGRQYQLSLPKTVVKLMGLKHKDEFKLEIEGNKIILTKC
jgi:antitoxin component of MazEF toxin-antitoxin module